MRKLVLGLLFSTLSFSAFAQSLNQMAFEALLKSSATAKVKMAGSDAPARPLSQLLASALLNTEGATTSTSNECTRLSDKLLECQLVIGKIAVPPARSEDVEMAYILTYKAALSTGTSRMTVAIQGTVNLIIAE